MTGPEEDLLRPPSLRAMIGPEDCRTCPTVLAYWRFFFFFSFIFFFFFLAGSRRQLFSAPATALRQVAVSEVGSLKKWVRSRGRQISIG